MKMTLSSCKTIRFGFLLFGLALLITGVVGLIFVGIQGLSTGLLVLFVLFATIGLYASIYCIAYIRIYVYSIDNHEVICFTGPTHEYIIVDEQVVDKATTSTFNPPTLTHKLGNKQLEYSRKRLKVNGELVLPNR